MCSRGQSRSVTWLPRCYVAVPLVSKTTTPSISAASNQQNLAKRSKGGRRQVLEVQLHELEEELGLEYERRMRELDRRVDADDQLTEWRRWTGHLPLPRRKRKKKKRRLLPFLDLPALGNLDILLRALPFWQYMFCVWVSPATVWVDSGYLFNCQLEAFPTIPGFPTDADGRTTTAQGSNGGTLVTFRLFVLVPKTHQKKSIS